MCLFYGIGTEEGIEEAHELLACAIPNFYKCRGNFIIHNINKTVKACRRLEEETLDDQDKI